MPTPSSAASDQESHNPHAHSCPDGEEQPELRTRHVDDVLTISALHAARSHLDSLREQDKPAENDVMVPLRSAVSSSRDVGGRRPAQQGASPRDKDRSGRVRPGAKLSPVLSSRVATDIDDGDYAPAGPRRWVEDSGLAGMGAESAQRRTIPLCCSSFLRPGGRFFGTQSSGDQRYEVQVDIKHVDLRESFLCGYLRIQGLTDDHPTLTTYFEGEIIGPKYSFVTQHTSWGATETIDKIHWGKFAPFKTAFSRAVAKGDWPVLYDVAQRDNIFMRWKEHFLVPDHRVKTITGASFDGFYYICFNQLRGSIDGIYFHSKSEKFQNLNLLHVEDKGCFGATEFR